MRVACYDRTSVYEEAKISNDAQYDAVKEYVLEKYEQIPQRFSDKGESGEKASLGLCVRRRGGDLCLAL